MKFGYARVSSREQNLSRQQIELENFGCEVIYSEKISGKDFNRPEFKKMISKMRKMDILVVHDLSRLGRNKTEIINTWQALIAEGVDIVVLNMPILDTRNYTELEGVGKLVSEIVLSLLSWMVEEERNNIRKSQKEGIELAKKKGLYKGKQTKYHAEARGTDKLIYEEVVRLLKSNEKKIYIQEVTGLSRPTINKIEKSLDND